jgi:hypothetical protein
MRPYQFVILRYINNIVSGEFVNIGLLMWLPDERRMSYYVNSNSSRMSHFFYPFDVTGYKQMVHRIVTRFSRGQSDVDQLHLFKKTPESLSELQNRIIKEDSSCFQWSSVKSGMVESPEKRFKQLVGELIARHEHKDVYERRKDSRILRNIEDSLEQYGLIPQLRKTRNFSSAHISFEFKLSWQNRVPQVLQPISFDYENGGDIINKALIWNGRLQALRKGPTFKMTGVVAPPRNLNYQDQYDDAFAILSEAPNVRKIITEDEFESFIPEIEHDLQAH